MSQYRANFQLRWYVNDTVVSKAFLPMPIFYANRRFSFMDRLRILFGGVVSVSCEPLNRDVLDRLVSVLEIEPGNEERKPKESQ